MLKKGTKLPKRSEEHLEMTEEDIARDFETKYRCFQELKQLYGLQRGNPQFIPRNELTITDEDIAKETGISQPTANNQHRQQTNIPKHTPHHKHAFRQHNIPFNFLKGRECMVVVLWCFGYRSLEVL